MTGGGEGLQESLGGSELAQANSQSKTYWKYMLFSLRRWNAAPPPQSVCGCPLRRGTCGVCFKMESDRILSAHKHGCWQGEMHQVLRINPSSLYPSWMFSTTAYVPPWAAPYSQAGSRPYGHICQLSLLLSSQTSHVSRPFNILLMKKRAEFIFLSLPLLQSSPQWFFNYLDAKTRHFLWPYFLDIEVPTMLGLTSIRLLWHQLVLNTCVYRFRWKRLLSPEIGELLWSEVQWALNCLHFQYNATCRGHSKKEVGALDRLFVQSTELLGCALYPLSPGRHWMPAFWNQAQWHMNALRKKAYPQRTRGGTVVAD